MAIIPSFCFGLIRFPAWAESDVHPDRRAVRRFGHDNLLINPLLQLLHMGDNADQPLAVRQLQQHVDGTAQRVFIQRAEALVDEHRVHANLPALALHRVRKPQRQREAGQKRFAAGKRGHVARLPGAPVQHLQIEAALADAAEAIRKAKRPMMICGGGVRYSEAHAEFLHFAETFGIPYGETQAGKSATDWLHPLNLGGVGTTGCSAANEIARKADLVIGVGTRYTDFTTASKWLFKDTCKFVNINVSEFQSLKMEAVPVVADAKEALPRLEKLLEGYQTAYKDEVKVAKEKWIDELNRLDHITFSDKKSWPPEITDANADSAKRFAQDVNAQLTQTSALGAINAMMSEGDVAIGAAGSLPGDMQRMWRPTGVDTYNMEYGYSTMGYEVAGALGVKLAIGDKHEVYSFCGDGSFNMLHGELITACQEHKKINICLFDNASFGCINNLQVGHGNVTLCTELRYRNKDGLFGNFMNIDYAKVAEAYGCKSYTVRTMEELVAAFEDAKKVKNIPVLFDIKVLPKTMTDGYSSWWRVGDTEVSERKENLAAYADLQAHLKEVRKY